MFGHHIVSNLKLVSLEVVHGGFGGMFRIIILL